MMTILDVKIKIRFEDQLIQIKFKNAAVLGMFKGNAWNNLRNVQKKISINSNISSDLYTMFSMGPDFWYIHI